MFGAGPSTQPILITNVVCSGNESNIAECSHSDMNSVGHCLHVDDVGVICEGKFYSYREDLLAGCSVNLTVASSACDIRVHTIINFVTALFYSGVKFAGIVGLMLRKSGSLWQYCMTNKQLFFSMVMICW